MNNTDTTNNKYSDTSSDKLYKLHTNIFQYRHKILPEEPIMSKGKLLKHRRTTKIGDVGIEMKQLIT